ncbi:MAG: hypothetical protein Kow0098_21020 [Ignavibacteriaceae bacterium]
MGFTTILDILGSTIIGGLLILTLMRLQDNSVDQQITWGHDKILQDEISNLATTIEEDFRKMGYCADPSQIVDTTILIVFADTSSLKYRSDLDNNGTLEYIHYYLGPVSELSFTPNPRDRILYRKINNEIPLIISNNITDLQFRYYDTFKNELSTPVSNTKLIEALQITFKVEDPDAYDEDYSSAFWSQLRLTSRNLRKR